MLNTTVRTDRMSWTEYRRRLAAQPVVVLPAGAHEQHGPHLPMGTDAIFATDMAEAVARQMNGLVLPTLCYGYKSQARSGGGQTFIGTASLDGHTLSLQALDILRELGRHGVTKVVVLDGHYENQWFLTEAIELAQREFRLAGICMRIIRVEYWNFCPQSVLDEVFDCNFPGYDLEHAALIETSMMLHWHPELVDLQSIPDDPPARFAHFDHYPQDGLGVPASGVLAPAAAASAQKGQLICDATIAAMVSSLGGFFARDQ
ncbi:MAG: creatininase [Halioglobus sp.]